MRRHILPIIILPMLLWSATASAGERFCLRLDPDNNQIYDASPRPTSGLDYLEDYGRRGGNDWGIAGMDVHIETMAGTDVWGSTTCYMGLCVIHPLTLDSQGCTDYVDTPGGAAEETFRIRYYHSGSFVTDSSYHIYDCSSENPYYPTNCASATNVIENVTVPAGSNVTYYENLVMSIENMLAWELAFSMKRFPLFSTPISVKYYDAPAATYFGITSSHTTWSGLGNPEINIRTTGWRNKTTMSHEYGHVYSVFRVSSLSSSDLDYCYGSSPPCGHSLTSPEFQAAAATEGFADFLSTAIWNNGGLNAQAYLPVPSSSTAGTLIDFEGNQTGYETKYYETNVCSGTCVSGVGVQLDWGRTFWDVYTNYSPAPSINSLALVFDDIYPWPVNSNNNAYYTDFHNGVENVLSSTWESRFEYLAQSNGIDW